MNRENTETTVDAKQAQGELPISYLKVRNQQAIDYGGNQLLPIPLLGYIARALIRDFLIPQKAKQERFSPCPN
jgi:hypothetical protein